MDSGFMDPLFSFSLKKRDTIGLMNSHILAYVCSGVYAVQFVWIGKTSALK